MSSPELDASTSNAVEAPASSSLAAAMSAPASILAALGSALASNRSQGIPPLSSIQNYSPVPSPRYTQRTERNSYSAPVSPIPSAPATVQVPSVPVVPLSARSPIRTPSVSASPVASAAVLPRTPLRTPSLSSSLGKTPVSSRSSMSSARTALTSAATPRSQNSPINPLIASSPLSLSSAPTTPILPPTPDQRQNLDQPLSFESEGVAVSQDSIEHDLAKLQYIVTAKVLIDSGNGPEARYLETINPRGKKVFIELDNEGFIAVTPNDLTLHEGKMATVIPYSVKVGALECAGLDVCGIAFVCDNGICTLSSDYANDNKQVETNFIYTENPEIEVKSDGAARLADRITPYPIVRLSELRRKPDVVLKNVDEVTRRIRNTAYAGCISDLKASEDAIEKLQATFAEFKKAQLDVSSRLTNSLKELEKVNEQYIHTPPVTDTQIKNHQLMITNFKKRHELAVDLLYTCKRVGKIRDEINSITQQLKEATSSLKKEFSGVEYVLTE